MTLLQVAFTQVILFIGRRGFKLVQAGYAEAFCAFVAVVSSADCAGIAVFRGSNVTWMVNMEAQHSYGLLGLWYCSALTCEGGKVALSSTISLPLLGRGKKGTWR